MLSNSARAHLAWIVIWLAPAALLSGCAGVGSGPREKIVIDSEPQGARVYVTGREVGVTPVTVVLDEVFPKHWTTRINDDEQGFAFHRRLETVDLKKDGCETVTRKLVEHEMDRDVVKFALKCDPNYKPAPAVPPIAQPAGIEQRLRALDELKQKGLISDEEYRSQRQRILGSL